MTNQHHYNKKLIQQIALLMVIVIALIFLLPFGAAPNVPTNNNRTINTEFDTEALKKVEEKGSNYPDLKPSPGELGKQDPFS